MAKEITKQALSLFEQIKQTDENGNEYWAARQLAKVLEYTDFRNFSAVITKAKEACTNSGQLIENHLVGFNEMVPIGTGAYRQMESVKLSRYACYLVVQNADPGKELVALRQTIKELGGTMPENLPSADSIKKTGKANAPKKIKR